MADVYCRGKYFPSPYQETIDRLGIMPEVTAEDQKILEDPEAYPDQLGIN